MPRGAGLYRCKVLAPAKAKRGAMLRARFSIALARPAVAKGCGMVPHGSRTSQDGSPARLDGPLAGQDAHIGQSENRSEFMPRGAGLYR